VIRKRQSPACRVPTLDVLRGESQNRRSPVADPGAKAMTGVQIVNGASPHCSSCCPTTTRKISAITSNRSSRRRVARDNMRAWLQLRATGAEQGPGYPSNFLECAAGQFEEAFTTWQDKAALAARALGHPTGDHGLPQRCRHFLFFFFLDHFG